VLKKLIDYQFSTYVLNHDYCSTIIMYIFDIHSALGVGYE